MDVPLTLATGSPIARSGGGRTWRSCRGGPTAALARTTWGATIARARRLARALVAAGVKPGERVATLMWNHAAHLEAYFGDPARGRGVAHAEPAAAPRRDRVHRERRAGSAADRRRRACCRCSTRSIAAGAKFERVIVVGRCRRGARDELRRVRRGRAGRRGAAGAARERRARHVLHERHDRAAEGRRVHAPLDAAAHAGRGAAGLARAVARGHAAAGRADVPRQRVGLAVRRGDARTRSSCCPGRTSIAPSAARPAGGRARDDRRGRADDLDRHPRRARRRRPGSGRCGRGCG